MAFGGAVALLGNLLLSYFVQQLYLHRPASLKCDGAGDVAECVADAITVKTMPLVTAVLFGLAVLAGWLLIRRARRRGCTAESRPAGRVDPDMTLTGEYEPSATGWVREQVEQIMRTGTTDGVTIRGMPTVLITYRGAKSGKVRKTPVMRVEHGGRYAAVASVGGAPRNPQWYASLVAEPVVELQDGTTTREYRAREIFGEEKADWWRRAVDAYPPYADYQRKTDREIPVFVLEPTGS